MAKKKQYYVIIHGRRPGLYDRWFGEEGAAEQVDGLADAVYKMPIYGSNWSSCASSTTLSFAGSGVTAATRTTNAATNWQ
jgi:viroplasmin and RNaseH domain-containing protein